MYDQEYNVRHAQGLQTFKLINLQCKHTHDYNDLLFHLFVDCLICTPRGIDAEHNTRESLIMFIKENMEKVKIIAQPFLKKKKLSLQDYIDFISTLGNHGDELDLHLLAVMHQICYCMITKSKVFYSHPIAFPTTLVYLGNSVFRDMMTLSKKSPPPPHIGFNQPLPSTPLQEDLAIRTERSRNSYKNLKVIIIIMIIIIYLTYIHIMIVLTF